MRIGLLSEDEKIVRAEESRIRWRAKNPDYYKDSLSRNRENRVEAYRKWRAANPDKAKERNKKYLAENPWKSNEWAARRRARKRKAMPQWLTDAERIQIKLFYKEAKKTGLTVDHIVPLQGKTVSGLHVPWNLQLLSLIENKRKNNRFDF